MSQFFIRAAGSPGVGTVTDVTGTLPIVITGNPTINPNVTINNATTSTVGAASFNPTEFTVSGAGEVSLIGGPVSGLTGITPQFQDNGITSPGTVITSANPLIYGSTANAAQVVDTWNTTSSATGTLAIEDRTFVTPFVVDASAVLGARGTYTTIAAAITAAAAAATALSIPQNVYIRPGTYTENPTAQPNVNLIGLVPSGGTTPVIIIGTITFTQAGIVNIANVTLQTNSAALLAVTGSAASVVNLNNSYLNCANNTGITYSSSSSSSAINILSCQGNLGTTGIGYFAHSSAGQLTMNYGIFTNTGASTTASTCSAGILVMEYNDFFAPLSISSAAILSCNFNRIFNDTTNTTCITYNSSSTVSACKFNNIHSGSAAAISISSGQSLGVEWNEINTTATAAWGGSGTIKNAGNNFNHSYGIGSCAVTPWQLGPIMNCIGFAGNYTKVTGATYQVLVTDMIIGVNRAGAVTITLPSITGLTTGQQWRIKDESGDALVYNITITTGSGSVNIDGAETKVISSNYGSIDLYFNGTQFYVV